jgi:hypothetical protein
MAFKCGLLSQAAFHCRPGLPRDPVQGVIAIPRFLCEGIEGAFGLVPPAHVLDHHAVTMIHKKAVIRQ